MLAHLITGVMSCSNIRAFMVEKVGWGLVWLKFTFRTSAPFCPGHLVHLIILAVTLFYQLGPKISRLALLLNLGHYDNRCLSIPWNKRGSCQLLLLRQESILEIRVFLCKHFLCPEESFSQVAFPKISVFKLSLFGSQGALIVWGSRQGQRERAALFPFD
jgi:hypothetical protein